MGHQRSHLSDRDRIANLRMNLRGRARYIEHKFNTGKAKDIKSEYISEILDSVLELKGILQESKDKKLVNADNLEALEFHCYAAQVLYFDKEDFARYFAVLKQEILPLLKAI